MHSSGPVGYGVSVDHLRGMAGILQFQEHVGDITTPYDRDAVVKAFHWLKKILFLSPVRNTVCLFPNNNT